MSLCLLNIHSLFPAKEIFLKQYIEMALLANTVLFDFFGFYVPGTLRAKRQQSSVRKYPNWSAKQIINYNFV